MIFLGAVYGGPEIRTSSFHRVLGGLVDLTAGAEPQETGSLEVVFHVPGSIIAPDFQGLRTGTLWRKKRKLAVQVAVPPAILAADDVELRAFLMSSLREAIATAAPVFERAKIPYPEDDLRTAVDRMEQAFLH